VTAAPAADAVVVDTSVYGELFLKRDSDILPLYTEHLRGKRLILPFMVVAEMRFWASNWGEQRRGHLEAKMGEAATNGLTDDLMDAYVSLQRACQDIGHGLCQKEHVADRWIAATAILRSLPLVAHDRIFVDTPNLTFITELRN
jgi:predicted nucleic acid-binding protein